MKKISFYISILILLSSCHKYYYDSGYPCDYCYNDEPKEGILYIELTIDSKHPSVPIVIYNGVIEDNKIIWTDTAIEKTYDIFVPIDSSYTVTAEYMVNNKKIIAVDEAKVHMKKNTSDCDQDCWIVFDGFVDNTLKYDDIKK